VLAVTVAFEIKPAFVAAFRQEIVANAQASVRDEQGCRQFDVCEDSATPGRFFLYELYESRAAFDAHLASLHFARFNETTERWIVSRQAQFMTRICPQSETRKNKPRRDVP